MIKIKSDYTVHEIVDRHRGDEFYKIVQIFHFQTTRAGFSWWGVWGPAIGVGDGAQGDCPSPLHPPPKKNPGKYFFRANVM